MAISARILLDGATAELPQPVAAGQALVLRARFSGGTPIDPAILLQMPDGTEQLATPAAGLVADGADWIWTVTLSGGDYLAQSLCTEPLGATSPVLLVRIIGDAGNEPLPQIPGTSLADTAAQEVLKIPTVYDLSLADTVTDLAGLLVVALQAGEPVLVDGTVMGGVLEAAANTHAWQLQADAAAQASVAALANAQAAVASGVVRAATLTALQALLAYPAGALGEVYAGTGNTLTVNGQSVTDTTGQYRKVGTSGAGYWQLEAAMTVSQLATATAVLDPTLTDPASPVSGIVPVLHLAATEDAAKGVPVMWFDASTKLLHLDGLYLHAVTAPSLQAAYWTAADAYAPNTLVNPSTSATVPVSSNDNDGQRRRNWLWDAGAIYVFIWCGQSLNGGQASLLHAPTTAQTNPATGVAYTQGDLDAITARTYTPLSTLSFNPYPTKLLMPDSGSNIVGQSWASLVPCVEYYKVPSGTLTPSGETPVTQALAEMARCWAADFPDLLAAGQMPTMVGINIAVGSSSFLNLGPGRPDFTDLVKFFRWLVPYARDTLGKRVVAIAGQYRGLEADWSIPRHLDLWNQDSGDATILTGRETEMMAMSLSRYRAEIEGAVRPITGQPEPFTLFVDQVQVGASSYTSATHNPRATEAQLNLNRYDPLCVPTGSKGACWMNPLDFIHPSRHGYAWQGQYDGAIMYRHFFRAEPFTALKAIEFYRSGASTYDLRFSRHVTLLPDDSIVDVSALGAGKGITLLDGGAALVPISGVTQTAPDTLRVTTSGSGTGYRTLRAHIGLQSNGNRRGNRTGARSAIVAGASGTPYGSSPNAPLVVLGGAITVQPLFTAIHAPTAYNEINDEGTAWFSYPSPRLGLEMAAHQRILLEGN